MDSRVWIGVGVAATLLEASAFGVVVYEQPPEAPQQFSWGGASSRWTENTPSQTITADAFELATPATVTGVKFWGRFVWTAPPEPPTQYRMTIYNNDGPVSANGVLPAPGSILAAFTLNVNDPGFVYSPSTTPLPFIAPDMYEATLPMAVQLAANTRYWISIAGVGPAEGLPWSWSNSSALSQGQGEYNVFSADSWWVFEAGPNTRGRAWGLTGVPTTGTLAVLGAAGLVLVRRRR